VWPYSLVPLGERALTIDLSAVGAPSIRGLIASLDARIRGDATPGITGCVPAIRAYTLHYEPSRLSGDTLQAYVESVMTSLVIGATPPREPIVIPVCYGGEFGPDLDVVATTHRTTPDAIIAAHTAGEYTVAMIGFLPGFPYLEGLAPALHTPRRAAPRTSVPAGSVGIGGTSTGIYPCSSPGGWQLIGRTPRTLFSAHRATPALLAPGDVVRFVAIAPTEWAAHRDST
jgi:inhibitor of KinA